MFPILLRVFLLVVEVLCSILLIGVVLIQKSKGGGLSGAAFGGGGMGESLLGARAGNVLTKITIVLTVLFLTNTLVLAFIYAGPGDPSLMDQMSPPTAADIRTVEPRPPSQPGTPGPSGAPADPGDMPVELPAPSSGTPGLAPAIPGDQVPIPEPAPLGVSEEPADL